MDFVPNRPNSKIVQDRFPLAGRGFNRQFNVDGNTPDFVFGPTEEYYRANGSRTTPTQAFEYTGGLATMTDQDGNLKWAPHNLLTYSEDFSNAAWTLASSMVKTSTSEADPKGGSSAGLFTSPDALADVFRTEAVTGGVTYTFAFWAKAGTITEAKYRIFDNTNSADIVGVTSYFSSLSTSEFTLIEIEFTTPATCSQVLLFPYANSGAGTFTLALGHFYRSDLGGMVNNPETGDSYVRTAGREISAELVTNGDFETVGPELVTNGDFAAIGDEALTGSWATPATFNNTTSGTGASVTATGASGTSRSYLEIDNIVSGKIYRLTVTLNSISSGTFEAYARDGSNPNAGTILASQTGIAALDVVELYFTATSSAATVLLSSQSGVAADFDVTASVVEVLEGWSALNSTLALSSGGIGVTNTTTGFGYAKQQLTLEDEKIYQVSVDISADETSRIRVGTNATPNSIYDSGDISSAETLIFTFTAASVNDLYLSLINTSLTNGTTATFDNISVTEVLEGWTIDDGSNGSVALDDNALFVTSDGGTGYPGANQSFATEVGKLYQLSAEWSDNTTGVWIRKTDSSTISGGTNAVALANNSADASGSGSVTFTATATTTYVSCFAEQNNSGSVYIDNVSIKQIDVDPSAARYLPRDGHHKKTGANKYNAHNLLPYSEDFSSLGTNAAGTGSAPVVTANAALAPDGSMTADRVQFDLNGGTTVSDISAFQEVAGVDGVNRTLRLWIKTVDGSAGQIHFRNGTNSPQLFAVTGEWTQITTDFDGSDTTILIGLRGGIGGTSDALDVYLWGLHLYRSDLEVVANSGNSVSGLYVPTTDTAVAATFVPATFVNKGRRLESEARTNLVRNSEDYTDWSTLGTGSATAGGNNGFTIWSAPNVTNRLHANAAYSMADGETVTGSWVIDTSQSTGFNQNIQLYVGEAGSNRAVVPLIISGDTLTLGTASISGSGFSIVKAYDPEEIDAGVFRVSLAMENTSGGVVDIIIGFWQVTGVAVDLAVKQPQLEVGATPSSYIPTNGSTATRTAQTLTVPGDIAPWAALNFATGVELVTNGGFDSDTTGWTPAVATIASVGGEIEITSTGGNRPKATQVITTEVGKIYRISALARQGTTSEPLEIEIAGIGSASTGTMSSTTQAEIYSTFVATSTSHTLQIKMDTDPTAVGETAYFDNVSVKELSSNYGVSIAMKGEMDYADEGTNDPILRWYLDGNNYFIWERSTTSTRTGKINFFQVATGVADVVLSADDAYTPGLNVPFNIASYHQPNGINGAVDGTALTEDTTPTALADLSATDIEIGYDFMGTIERFTVFPVALTDAQLETATS